jgi:hypothetical protein
MKVHPTGIIVFLIEFYPQWGRPLKKVYVGRVRRHNIFVYSEDYGITVGRNVVLLSMLMFSLVVAVSTFGRRTKRRYNNTHRTYGVSLQHEGSISELHWCKEFFSRPREDRTFFLAKTGNW